ncbi:hypothetical protein EV144_102510 [Flavobacterium sp. 270]|uniref:DUF1214 domain-containing protein n=1 Tax=Flavobacterium sp. 270 TaxID=2512114 RepID=UPI0010655502|nr:DUF1214 domain-containing protein [Flavobacterium sp. 270]TDW50076.1 hypothetical protein EV144_102510 [Flavobacterium sp. 270]
MKTKILIFSFLLLTACGGKEKQKENNSTVKADTTATVTQKDIADAYTYLLGRDLVLKQLRLDFEKEGFQWNKLIYRTPGGVAWANPNLDVAYTEAWVAVDENTCVLLEIPKITGRYYTWHMLNGWGETILNINERNYPQQPYGKFALCLKGSNPKIPEGALRIDLPCKLSRVLARVELGANIQEAIKIQKQFKLTLQGQPKIETPIKVPLFESLKFPGAELFENATALLNSETDINEGMEPLQEKVKAVENLLKSDDKGKVEIDKAIKEIAQPAIFKRIQNLGLTKNGWTRPPVVGNYGNDYQLRTVVNIVGIWANSGKEAIYYAKVGLDGNKTYVLTFPKEALPKEKSKYFWSIIAVDGTKYQVLPNPMKRYLLNNQSGLKYNTDGSLTLVFAPKPLAEYSKSNWLPTIENVKYNLTLRFYGPTADVSSGEYFPPEIVEK